MYIDNEHERKNGMHIIVQWNLDYEYNSRLYYRLSVNGSRNISDELQQTSKIHKSNRFIKLKRVYICLDKG